MLDAEKQPWVPVRCQNSRQPVGFRPSAASLLDLTPEHCASFWAPEYEFLALGLHPLVCPCSQCRELAVVSSDGAHGVRHGAYLQLWTTERGRTRCWAITDHTCPGSYWSGPYGDVRPLAKSLRRFLGSRLHFSGDRRWCLVVSIAFAVLFLFDSSPRTNSALNS